MLNYAKSVLEIIEHIRNSNIFFSDLGKLIEATCLKLCPSATECVIHAYAYNTITRYN